MTKAASPGVTVVSTVSSEPRHTLPLTSSQESDTTLSQQITTVSQDSAATTQESTKSQDSNTTSQPSTEQVSNEQYITRQGDVSTTIEVKIIESNFAYKLFLKVKHSAEILHSQEIKPQRYQLAILSAAGDSKWKNLTLIFADVCSSCQCQENIASNYLLPCMLQNRGCNK